MRVLVVDDDAVARTTLAALLQAWGHEVTVASDGREAWGDLELSHYPVVISDWSMPEMDGLDLCRRVRARRTERYTYFVLVTATGGKQRYLEGMEAGADDFIAKPVDPQELRARLTVAERILSLRRELSQLEGLLPICAYCKRIRDAGERWQPIERYVEQRSEAQFSHGICPDCYARHIQPSLEG